MRHRLTIILGLALALVMATGALAGTVAETFVEGGAGNQFSGDVFGYHDSDSLLSDVPPSSLRDQSPNALAAGIKAVKVGEHCLARQSAISLRFQQLLCSLRRFDDRFDQRHTQTAFFEFEDAVDRAAGRGSHGVL